MRQSGRSAPTPCRSRRGRRGFRSGAWVRRQWEVSPERRGRRTRNTERGTRNEGAATFRVPCSVFYVRTPVAFLPHMCDWGHVSLSEGAEGLAGADGLTAVVLRDGGLQDLRDEARLHR